MGSVIKEDMYIILLKFFEGDVNNLTIQKVKDLKNLVFDGKPIQAVDESILKKFGKILRRSKKDPKGFAALKWIYPKWDDEEKERRLKEAFPEDYEEGQKEEEVIKDDGQPVIVHDEKQFISKSLHFLIDFLLISSRDSSP